MSLNACVVYYAWGNPKYLLFMRLSLLSQETCTDISHVDVKVFVDSSLFAEACRILGGLSGADILEHPGVFGSHAVTFRPELAGYEKIILVDADVFFHGSHFPLYATLCGRNELMAMEPDGNRGGKMFSRGRMFSEAYGSLSKDEYFAAFSRCADVSADALLTLMEEAPWPYGCFVSLDRRLLQTSDWRGYASRCVSELRTWCCESVFTAYGITRGIPVGDLNSMSGFSLAVSDAAEASLLKPENRLLALHPHPFDRDRILGPLARRLVPESTEGSAD